MLVVRMRDGRSRTVADPRPGQLVGPGTVVRSGDALGSVHRIGYAAPAGLSGPLPRPGRREFSTPAIVGIGVGALLHLLVLATVELDGILVLTWLSGIVFGTLALHHRFPRAWSGGRRVAMVLVAGTAVVFLALVIAALPTGYTGDTPDNAAAGIAFTVVALVVYGLWAVSLWFRTGAG